MSARETVDVRSRLILDGRRVWTGNFLPTLELIRLLVELRPDLWGTIRDGRELSPQMLDAILRTDDYPASARPLRYAGRKGRYRHQWIGLLESIPPDAEAVLRGDASGGGRGLLLELGPGMLELLEVGGVCRILPIVHQSAWDRAPRQAWRVTVEPERPTLAP